MADDRAQRMADWIVANADKKGTPEFQTVASALKELQAGGGQPAPVLPVKPPAPDVDSTWGEYGKNLLRQAGQGLTFNFGDEITAGARSLFGDETYDQALADERSKIDEFAKRNPWASTAANVGGALVGGGGIGMGVRGAAKAGSSLAGRFASATAANPIGAGGITGAASGALAGFGEGEGGLENRVASAGMGALVGGIGGTAAGALISAAPAVKRIYQERIAKNDDAIKASAEREVGKYMERSGKTADELKARLAEDRGLGVPSTLLNADDELAKLGNTVQTKGGTGARELTELVDSQQAGNNARVYGNLRKGVSDADYYASEDAVLDRLKKTGAAHYDNAPWMSQEVADPRIAEFMKTPVGQQAFARARSIVEKEKLALEMEGKDASHLALKESGTPDLRTLDLMKRGMQSMIDDGFASANGMTKADAAGLKKIKDVYLKALDGISPEYRQARAAYRGDAEVRDALEMGRKEFLTSDADGLKRTLADMSDAEKEAYNIGAVKALRQRIFNQAGNADRADASKKVAIESTEMRDKLAALVGDPEKADLMIAAIKREGDIFRQGQMASGRGQSTTADKIERGKDFDGSPGVDIVEAAMSPKTMALKAFVNWVAKNDFRMTELKANEVSKILQKGSPEDIDALMATLTKRQSQTAESTAKLTDRSRMAGQAVGDQSAEAVGVDDPSTKQPMEITIHPKPRQQQYAKGGPVQPRRNFAQELAAEIQSRVPSFQTKPRGGLAALRRQSLGQSV